MDDNDELCGKYQSTSHINGKNYARVWYNGDNVDPKRTYTERYLEKHNLKTGKIQKTESTKSSEVEEDDDDSENQSIGILGKILLMPFKIIWWIIKQLLKFIGLSFLLTIFSSNNNDD